MRVFYKIKNEFVICTCLLLSISSFPDTILNRLRLVSFVWNRRYHLFIYTHLRPFRTSIINIAIVSCLWPQGPETPKHYKFHEPGKLNYTRYKSFDEDSSPGGGSTGANPNEFFFFLQTNLFQMSHMINVQHVYFTSKN